MDEEFVSLIKQKWYGHSIIYVHFLNDVFLFRTLSREEYRIIKAQRLQPYEHNEKICSQACVYPEGYDFSLCPYAGFPDTAAKEIEKYSGFTDIHIILDSYYAERDTKTLEQQCMDLIKAFIPEYTYEQMESWTWHQLMKTAARAERVAKLKAAAAGVENFDLHLNDKTEEMEKEFEAMNSDNKDFIMNLYEHGVDPMVHFKNEIQFTHEIVEVPLIIGKSFDNEEVLNAVRKQINKKNTRKKG